MYFNFSQCSRPDNFWFDDFMRTTRTEKKYQEGEKEVVIYEESIPFGIARQNAWMEYRLKEQTMKTDKVRRITYEEESGIFLFEDYILMDDDFDFVSSLFYYVDFNGNIISKAFSNVVEETYDIMNYEGFNDDSTCDSIFTYQYRLLIDRITKDIQKKYEEKNRNSQKVLQKEILRNNQK